eukprot:5212620-Amphidinium_carterae.1
MQADDYSSRPCTSGWFPGGGDSSPLSQGASYHPPEAVPRLNLLLMQAISPLLHQLLECMFCKC